LAVFALLVGIDLSYGIGTADDSWSLYVFHRVAGGNVLYRDVFYGATPLSVWIGAAATKLLGTQLYVLKALADACSVATALLAARIARQLGVGRVGQVLVAAASLAYLDFPSSNLYTPLAYALQLTSMTALLTWRRRAASGGAGATAASLFCAGLAAGPSVASKQNVGLLAVGALVVSVALLSPPDGSRRRVRVAELGAVLGAAAVGALAPMIPVVLGGALGDFIREDIHKGT